MTANKKNTLIDLNLAYHALDSANDGITIVDMKQPTQPLIYINTAFEKITGYSREEVLGKNCRFLQGNMTDQANIKTVHNAIQNRKNCRVILKNFKKNGTLFWNELSLAPLFNAEGELTHYVGVQKDVTVEMMQKEEIAYLSEHDVLTGLDNYRGFFTKINRLIQEGRKNGQSLMIGIADIDHFKLINDRHGHIKGNEVLRLIGSQFTIEFRPEDIVARFGGDEFCFAILIDGTNSEFFYNKINTVVTRINSMLTPSLHIAMSAGIAIEVLSEKTRIENLIHQADLVMYDNKQQKRS